jgi:predicted transcriptional regulator
MQKSGSKRKPSAGLTVRFDPEIRALVDQQAEVEKRSAASLIEIAVLDYLQKKGLLPK